MRGRKAPFHALQTMAPRPVRGRDLEGRTALPLFPVNAMSNLNTAPNLMEYTRERKRKRGTITLKWHQNCLDRIGIRFREYRFPSSDGLIFFSGSPFNRITANGKSKDGSHYNRQTFPHTNDCSRLKHRRRPFNGNRERKKNSISLENTLELFILFLMFYDAFVFVMFHDSALFLILGLREQGFLCE
ncbi:hypothetical protein NPIL_469861 [Nephila pilipes]|uniref:Uncharacterized protein n=1 Tax=Nephila pilipes TaxID=299642 RepID=A0A8X6NFG8_NEPPI|nr:hypothetical protein NPIL_469861 [Nephila pilipes]